MCEFEIFFHPELVWTPGTSLGLLYRLRWWKMRLCKSSVLGHTNTWHDKLLDFRFHLKWKENPKCNYKNIKKSLTYKLGWLLQNQCKQRSGLNAAHEWAKHPTFRVIVLIEASREFLRDVSGVHPNKQRTIRIIYPHKKNTIQKVKFLSKNSILTKPQHFHEFFTKFFLTIFLVK